METVIAAATIAAPFVIIGALFLCLYFQVKVYKKLSKVQTDTTGRTWLSEHTGLVYPGLKDLALCRDEASEAEMREAVKNGFPKDLALNFHPYSTKEISKASIQFFRRADSHGVRQAKRALTLAAALFRFPIPLSMYVNDKQTMLLLTAYLADMDSRHPKRTDREPRETTGYNVYESEALSKTMIYGFVSQMPKIGELLIELETRWGFLPLVEYYIAAFRKSRAKETMTFTDMEIKAMATAYAMACEMRLPKCYIVVNALTLALLDAMVPKEKTAV